MKRKIGDVLWLALEYAKQDRQSLIDAYDNDISQDAVKNALADVKSFEKIQVRLFGTSKTELQAKKMTPVSIFKILHEDLE